MQAARTPHLFTVADYMKLDIPGHTELFEGIVYDVSPKNPPHSLYAPEIDVAVIAEKPYRTTPTDKDAFALVEVSDTTYAADREEKIPLYVAAGGPTWHVNVPPRQVEFYPKGADLTQPTFIFAEHESFDILGVCGRVADLFARPS